MTYNLESLIVESCFVVVLLSRSSAFFISQFSDCCGHNLHGMDHHDHDDYPPFAVDKVSRCVDGFDETTWREYITDDKEKEFEDFIKDHITR